MAIVINPYTCSADGLVSYLLQCATTQRYALIDPPRRDTDCWRGINDCIGITPAGTLSWIFLTRVETHTIKSCEALKARHLCAQIAAPHTCTHEGIDCRLKDGAQITFGHCYGRMTNAGDGVSYRFDDLIFSTSIADPSMPERQFATRIAA